MNGGGGGGGWLWRGGQNRIKKTKKSERARDIIANPSCCSPCRASHFTGPPLACSPQVAEKGGPTFLRRGEGLAAAAPSRRGRDKTNGEAVVVVGDKRIVLHQRSLSPYYYYFLVKGPIHNLTYSGTIELVDMA